MAGSLRVSPSDLTRISARNGGTFPLAHISRIISGEKPLARGHGTHEMPVWGPIFSQVEGDRDLGHVRIDNWLAISNSYRSRSAMAERIHASTEAYRRLCLVIL